MTGAKLEHVNITVSDPDRTAATLCELFDWRIRWRGPSAMGGNTVHVGSEDAYVAVYTHPDVAEGPGKVRARADDRRHEPCRCRGRGSGRRRGSGQGRRSRAVRVTMTTNPDDASTFWTTTASSSRWCRIANAADRPCRRQRVCG